MLIYKKKSPVRLSSAVIRLIIIEPFVNIFSKFFLGIVFVSHFVLVINNDGTYSVAQGGHIAESARVLARRSAAPPRYRMALARQIRAMSSPCATKPRVQRPRDHDNQSTTPHDQSDCRQFTTSSLYLKLYTAATNRRVAADCT